MKKSTIIIVGLLVAVVFFYVGMKYDQSKAPASVATARVGFARGMRGAGGAQSGSAMSAPGRIISKDATSLTVSVQGGGSKIIFFTPTTPVQKTVAGAIGDLNVGQNISVTGSANTDGSITAQSIQIRPATTTKIQ
jgi:hypothetical protein